MKWIDYGLLDTDKVRRDGAGLRREFSQDQAERACLLRALHSKGVTLRQLARADLADPASGNSISHRICQIEFPDTTVGILSMGRWIAYFERPDWHPQLGVGQQVTENTERSPIKTLSAS
jgi:hypothetical protein